ncbi:hypothetical protein GCM10010172_54520 [Paractinoplanes ferrugineus]|uniref:Secreted protein n=1 Tax=Paractinoplanes ferrugineus TaxID=113564 RepID=A0A919MGK9_9ACTN|nr:hypothetical protein [Actinoplanes ferrugineus]GIE11730.1 hypothetical protein Afe05nite_35700 [Actinoplanes ferrugineus]
MSRSKKRLAVIGTGVAVAALTIGGVAFAAFNRSATANATGAGTETFEPLTANGTWMGRPDGNGYPANGKLLLPGESGDVQLVLGNPSSNTVQGKVVSITPTGLTNDCSGNLQLATYQPGGALVLDHGGSVTVTLKKAVSLKREATETCSGLRFDPKYTVVFEATREPVKTSPTGLEPLGSPVRSVAGAGTAQKSDEDSQVADTK